MKWLLVILLISGCAKAAPLPHPVARPLYFPKTLAPLTEKELVKRKGKRLEKRATDIVLKKPIRGDLIQELTRAAIAAQLKPTRANVDRLEKLLQEIQNPPPIQEEPLPPPPPAQVEPVPPPPNGGDGDQ